MSVAQMTAEQKTKFIELARIAEQKKIIGGQASKGAYAPVYEYLIECFAPTVSALLKISDTYTEVDVVANAALSASLALAIAALDETTKYSVIWLIGATGVNTGDGVFSSVIREYNIYQVQLRYDRVLTGDGADGKDLVQDASNAVGFLLAKQILESFTLPSVKEIGDIDLNGVRDTLYTTNGDNLEGHELFLNQAWPGIVMLNKLKETGYVDRLLQVNSTDPTDSVDTLSDVKNLLFSWASFEYAYEKTLGRTYELSVRDLAVTFNILGVSDLTKVTSKDLYLSLLAPSSSKANYYLAQIVELGAAAILNMLKSSFSGAVIKDVTAENFAAQAVAFFNNPSIGDERTKALTWLKGDSDEWCEVAKQNNAQGLAHRNALNALSIFAVEPTSAAGLDLYDATTGQGSLTQEWITDRAEMLSWVMKTRSVEGSNFLPVAADSGLSLYFSDSASSMSLSVANTFNDPNARRFLFGDDSGNTLVGGTREDHLYGMSGNDILNGHAGTDYLEGGSGNDVSAP